MFLRCHHERTTSKQASGNDQTNTSTNSFISTEYIYAIEQTSRRFDTISKKTDTGCVVVLITYKSNNPDWAPLIYLFSSIMLQLLWSADQGNMFSLRPFAPENLVSRDMFGCPVPPQPAYSTPPKLKVPMLLLLRPHPSSDVRYVYCNVYCTAVY